jgi:hypothetical protein
MKLKVLVLIFFITTTLFGQNSLQYTKAKQNLDKMVSDFTKLRPQNDNYWSTADKLDQALYNFLTTKESYIYDYKKYKDIIHFSTEIDTNSKKFKLVYFESNLNLSNGALYYHSFIQWKTNDSVCNVFKLGKSVDGRQLINSYILNDSTFLMLYSGWLTMYAQVLKFETKSFVSQNVFPVDYFNDLKNSSCENLEIKPNYLNCGQCEIKYNPTSKTLSFDKEFMCNSTEENGEKKIAFKFIAPDFKLVKINLEE